METSILITKLIRPVGNKILIGILIASTLGLLPLSSALADRDDWREGWHDRDRDEWRDRDRDGWERHRGYGNGYGYGGYQPAYPQSYGYAQPVYVPPPVQYMPPQSPGINLVIPLNFR